MQFMSIDIVFETLKSTFAPYYKSLVNFHFYFYNPLFWVFLLILFLILLRRWQEGKAFSYCLLLAIILLGATRFESMTRQALANYGQTFDPLPARVLVLVIIAILSICYAVLLE